MSQPVDIISKKEKKNPARPSSPTHNPNPKATNVPAGGVFAFDEDEEFVAPVAPAKKEFAVPGLLLPKKSRPASPRPCAESSFPAVIETAAEISSEINPSAPATN
jgi:hypothetical protein